MLKITDHLGWVPTIPNCSLSSGLGNIHWCWGSLMLEEWQKQGTHVASIHPDNTDTPKPTLFRGPPANSNHGKDAEVWAGYQEMRCQRPCPPMWPFSKNVISRSEHLTYLEKGWPETARVQLPDNHALPVTTWPTICPYYMLCNLLYGVKGVTILLLSAWEVKGPWLMRKAYSEEKEDITTH